MTTYRGHRARSFLAIDNAELVELRARQRMFEGAYLRTALGNLSYAVIVLKLFDKRFYRIGLSYTILASLLFVLAYLRGKQSNHDFSDLNRPSPPQPSSSSPPERRVFGRHFVTAGRIVLVVSILVAAVEVILFALILDLS